MPVFSDKHKEMVHWILYDRNPANINEFDDQGDGQTGFQNLLQGGGGNTLFFFKDVQRKTKLETNMDTSGMLTRNSFEVRAMRVVIAPLGSDTGNTLGTSGNSGSSGSGDTGVTNAPDPTLEEDTLPRAIEECIYNSVTTLRVGEKVYIEAPTFNFPAAAGPFGGNGSSSASNGEPNPTATFRFAEAITIPPQQSFEVQINFPRGIDNLDFLPDANVGVWVLLDGYLTRDVM